MDVIPRQVRDFYSRKIADESPFFSQRCTEDNHWHSGELSLKHSMQIPQFLSEKLTILPSDDMHYYPMVGDDSDWMLAERTIPRSPPASPEIKSNQSEGLYFNFSSASQTNKYTTCQPPSVSANTPRKRFRKRLIDPYSFPGIGEGQILYSQVNLEKYASDAVIPIENVNSSGLKQRADDIHSDATDSSTKSQKRVQTPKKRQRRGENKDWTREFGLRYLKQLKEDVHTLRMKLKRNGIDVSKSVNCTCSVMERYFMQTAESAYRSLRLIDCSPIGFQQFKNELIQTNAVLQDSIEVLGNIKSFCEHKY
ncbi:hypothetical protein ACJMK2_025491 [Sinanodonta woodiana]|uniref:Uncharacterized protein n=1 Tax=Sinanodonta woodiana TaxID=1069815 RepID=A0ABD3XGP5_SINWO